MRVEPTLHSGRFQVIAFAVPLGLVRRVPLTDSAWVPAKKTPLPPTAGHLLSTFHLRMTRPHASPEAVRERGA